MQMVRIQHRDERGRVNYPLYTKSEADKEKIEYKYWKECEPGDWALSDDDHVCQLLDIKTYRSRDKTARHHYRFPFGYVSFMNSQRKSIKCIAGGRDYTIIKDGCLVYKDKKRGNDKKNFVAAFAATGDADLATAILYPNPSERKITNGRKFIKTEQFRKMLREEIQDVLKDNGITEGSVIDLLKEAVELARAKGDISSFIRVAENFQKMLGIDSPDKVKTTNILEATKTRRLVDRVSEEEEKLKLTQTTGGMHVEKLPGDEGSPREVAEEEIEIIQTEEA